MNERQNEPSVCQEVVVVGVGVEAIAPVPVTVSLIRFIICSFSSNYISNRLAEIESKKTKGREMNHASFFAFILQSCELNIQSIFSISQTACVCVC